MLQSLLTLRFSPFSRKLKSDFDKGRFKVDLLNEKNGLVTGGFMLN